ncbi:MAG: glycoside hydrolase family 3 N-terminal domain-containing protein [Bacillales bacterium]|nr:glycoside hydrolase family 3 N-terminal domain-containing protein [Bacillales bacterium]
MNLKALKKKSVIAWGVSTAVIAALLTTVNVLGYTKYESLFDRVFGGKEAIIDKNGNGIDFHQDFFTKEEAYENGNKVTKEICEEGMILLKNDNNALPLKSNAKVSVFGKNSVNLVYGGSGSAAPDKNGKRATIFESLEAAGISYNPVLKEFYEDSKKSGTGRSENPAMENAGVATLLTGETEYSKYTSEVKDSYNQYGDAALVVLSRIAGENWDLPRKASDDESRHYLELDNNERELLKQIAESGKFEHIIVLLNGSNYIDLGFLKLTSDPAYNSKIDACINIGSPGANGIMALGEILTGKVNPSGKTVDTVYTNYSKDPVWQNFGGNFTKGGDSYLKQDGKPIPYYFVEYEENIYMGYRYYETRGYVEGETWYNNNVLYPFGYGLSYTTFEKSVVNVSELESTSLNATSKFDVEVKVKNTGDVAGKEVVQLYVTAPYTNNGIEKSYKVLCGFAKTGLLNPGKEETVKITVDPYDFASFDSHDLNGNGFRGYELDAGDYVFHAANDAHNDFGTFTKKLDSTYKFEKDPVTGTKVEPLFDEVTDYMTESLSRTNFEATFPHTTTDEERKVDNDFIAKLKSFETTNNETFDTVPTTNAEITVKFKDLINLDYNDPKWNAFLDQMTFEEMLRLFNEGCYSTADIERLGIPKTTSADGPTGLVSFLGNTTNLGQPEVYGCCYYCSECLVAQTYNLDLAAKQANAIGNEALVGNERGDGLSYPGWYAPGVNLHRSPFSGRNTEYYSEDPFLTGKMAATVIKGVQAKGVYANVKHFALNDQETHRSSKGIATWCDEQAMRELYLKAFEIAVKEGKSRGLMTSFNRIGTEWAGGSYRLLTTVLRKEWGFVGTVICDFHTDYYMDSKQMLYAGGDINLVSVEDNKLTTSGKFGTPYVSANNAKDVALLRRTAHNNLYALVNSNAMKADILGYKEAKWKVALKAVTISLSAAVVVWGATVITLALRKKETVAEE